MELLNCPFCGAPAETEKGQGNELYINCSQIGCCCEAIYATSEDQWNHRALPSGENAELIARLRDESERYDMYRHVRHAELMREAASALARQSPKLSEERIREIAEEHANLPVMNWNEKVQVFEAAINKALEEAR